MSRLPIQASLSALFACATILAACDSSSGGTTAPTVTATLAEYTISLGDSSIAAGKTKFSVTNSGAMHHEFVVLKTDFTSATVPKVSDGSVDEEGTGVTNVGEIGDIAPGKTSTLTLTLVAGHYLVICNIDDHFSKGMFTDLTVE